MTRPPARRAGGPITGNPGGPITLAESAHTGPILMADHSADGAVTFREVTAVRAETSAKDEWNREWVRPPVMPRYGLYASEPRNSNRTDDHSTGIEFPGPGTHLALRIDPLIDRRRDSPRHMLQSARSIPAGPLSIQGAARVGSRVAPALAARFDPGDPRRPSRCLQPPPHARRPNHGYGCHVQLGCDRTSCRSAAVP